jgi:CheY-like chemotaxis protein
MSPDHSVKAAGGPKVSTTKNPSELGELVVLNRDLFFGIKINNTLRGLGYRVSLVPTTEAFVARLRTDAPSLALGIIDMSAGVDWQQLAALTGTNEHDVPILVFGSHLDVEGRRAAKAAGVTRVVSNGDFHRDMVALVRRYARAVSVQPAS